MMDNSDFARLYNEAQNVRDTTLRSILENSVASAAATATTMASINAAPVIKEGSDSTREDVRRLQIALALNGADIRIDGKFDKTTRAALADFQKAAGLSPTGETDARTWQYLDGGNPSSAISTALANQAQIAAETLGKHVEQTLTSKDALTTESTQLIAAEAAAAEAIAAEALQAAEPFAAEPLGAEPLVAEPFGAEPLVAEPLAAEPNIAEPVAVEATRIDPLGTAFQEFRNAVSGDSKTDR